MKNTDMKSLTGRAGSETPPVPVEVASDQRRRLNVTVLLFLSAGAAVLVGRMLLPFVTAIITALVLSVLAYPGYRRLRRHIPWEWAASLLATSLLFVMVFLPLLGLSVALFNSLQANADSVAAGIGDFLAPGGRAGALLERAAGWLGAPDVPLAEAARNQVRELGSFLAGRTVGFLSGLGGGLVQVGVALFTLFYLLRDGAALLEAVEHAIPLDATLTRSLMERSREIIHATMYGNVVVGIAQGTLGGLLFWLLGIPGAVLWGSVMGVLGLLPIVGTPVVWGPAAAILMAEGEVARAVILVAAGALIVSTVDNILRATVVGGRAQLHPLVVFFSALGGILLFGIAGLFLGPVLFVLSVSILEVTRAVLTPEGAGEETPASG